LRCDRLACATLTLPRYPESNPTLCDRAQELWLDNNQLRRLSGLEGMVTLRVLSACSNQLETLEGLEGLQLHELYVNDNQLTTLEPIHSLQALRVMQVGDKSSGVHAET
jgi:Leucine-rich repeat (LRR) protein